MKKLLVLFAAAALLSACDQSGSRGGAGDDTSTGTDSPDYGTSTMTNQVTPSATNTLTPSPGTGAGDTSTSTNTGSAGSDAGTSGQNDQQ